MLGVERGSEARGSAWVGESVGAAAATREEASRRPRGKRFTWGG